MLNKFLLSFKSKSLELEYRQSQEPIIKQEFTAFTLQASLFLVFFSVYYFKGTTYFYTVLASTIFLCLLIISFKFIVDRNPHYANYLLPILQILMGLIQVIDYLLPFDDSYYVDNPEPNYNWFYGFQSCYYHMAILIQGYIIWPQVVVLSGILIAYVAYVHHSSLTYGSLFLSFISVLIGMIVIKYTIEKKKRQEFLHYRERKRWFKIIESTLHQSITVIYHDEQQDQLRIYQMNNLTKETLRITSDQDLRIMLRNMKQIQSDSRSQKPISLEQILRGMLIQKSPKNDMQQSQERCIKILQCTSNILNTQFKVQIIPYLVDEQQMMIMTVDTQKNITQEIQKQEINLLNKILHQISISGMKSLIKGDKIAQLITLNYMASIDIWFNKNLNNMKQLINSQDLINLLQHYFNQLNNNNNNNNNNNTNTNINKQKIQIINKLEVQHRLILNINALLYCITSIIQLQQQQQDRNSQIKIKLKFDQQMNILNLKDYRIKELIVNIKLNNCRINELIKTYLIKSTYFNTEDGHTSQIYKQFKMIDKYLGCKIPLKALSLVCLKLILWKYGVTNQIQIKDKQSYKTFRFSILCH